MIKTIKTTVKIVSFLLILLFLTYCTTTRFIAPAESSKMEKADSVIIELYDGTIMELKDAYLDGDTIIGYRQDEKKEIPVASIHSVQIKNNSLYYPLAFTGVAIVTAFLFIGKETAPTSPPVVSCPFIYSFDGGQYTLDAEPYGGAICRALERSEWCGLEHIREIDGAYRIMAVNQLDETDYIDELQLVVADHAQGSTVIPGIAGKMHTCLSPIAPLYARDKKGNDLLPMLSCKDAGYWEPRYEVTGPAAEADLKEELILEFPKPANAKKVKVLVNAKTTLWGARAASYFLKLYGRNLPDWYREVNSYGPAFTQLVSWYFNEGLFLLAIEVETKHGWKTKGMLYGGGPFMAEDRMYVLDTGDVPGTTLKIRLTPPVQFWMFDYFAVDYTDDLPVACMEIAPGKAVDCNGNNVVDLLTQNDNHYLGMPHTGDSVEVVFQAPARAASDTRTIFIKTSGYYHSNITGEGEPRLDLIERINNESGFSILYAWKQYQEQEEGK